MICYKCGCTLSEKDFCTGCGADVGMYKKILALSNRYYNDALDKCSVRDLSGAIVSLKQSIKLNKNNVDARNLLGLVYYEIGEVVEALGQWVISKNIRDSKNIATDYLDVIQENPNKLESMNQNLKKYNQSLSLCYQDSLDYATIQLKKILSMAPKYLRARQLLALIYIKGEEWDKAKIELDKCLAIDTKNTMCLRMLREVDTMLNPVEVNHVKGKKNKNDEHKVQVYRSGNETIIQPINKSESRTGITLLNIAIGLIIGIAVSYFLILPARIYSVNEDANNKISMISDEKDKKTSELEAVELEMTKLKAENEELKKYQISDGEEGGLSAYDVVMDAMNKYLENTEDIARVAESLEKLETPAGLDIVNKSEAFNTMYSRLVERAGSQLASFYFSRGYDSYQSEDYEAAVPNLERAYYYDKSNGDALFYLGNAYRRTGQDDLAKQTYANVIDHFQGTESASKAEIYLAEMNNE